MSVAIDTSALEAAMNTALENMMKVMKASIEYQSKTTEISTYLGQVASRAAKQTPQG
jgi:hypothetical protein